MWPNIETFIKQTAFFVFLNQCVQLWDVREGNFVTFQQCVHAYVAESEANDGGFVQVSPNRGLEWQQTRQISEYIRLNSSPPSGCFTADRPEEEGQMKNTS